MNITDYWATLSPEEKKQYAQRAGTSSAYIQVHLVRIPPSRVPRPDLYKSLISASMGEITREDMFNHFYED